MHVLSARRWLSAALVVGLMIALGAWLGARGVSAQAPPPPGPPGAIVDLCTGEVFDQSLADVATRLGVTYDQIHEAMQSTLQGVNAGEQQTATGVLQQVRTDPLSGVCRTRGTPAIPSAGTSAATPLPPGGPPGAGQITCTSSGSGQPVCTGPGSDQVQCASGTEADGRTMVMCIVGQPPSGSPPCPPTLVEGITAGSGPTTAMGPQSCAGAGTGAVLVHDAPACTASASAGVGIVAGSGGSAVVYELTTQGYDEVARHLGRGITGEQVRAAFCAVRR
jgi:hypothetical protein